MKRVNVLHVLLHYAPTALTLHSSGLLRAVFLHHLPLLLFQLGLDPALAFIDKPHHIVASAIVLALPGAACWAVDAVWRAALDSLGDEPVPVVAGAAAGAAPPLPKGEYTGVATTPKGPKTARRAGAAADATGAAGGAAAATGAGVDSGALSRALGVLRSAQAAAVAEAATTVAQAEAQGGVQPFVESAYGYLPLVWAATLAHYLDLFLFEAGHILPVSAGGQRESGHPELTWHLLGSKLYAWKQIICLYLYLQCVMRSAVVGRVGKGGSLGGLQKYDTCWLAC